MTALGTKRRSDKLALRVETGRTIEAERTAVFGSDRPGVAVPLSARRFCFAPISAAQPKLVVSRKRTSGRWGPSTIMGGLRTSTVGHEAPRQSLRPSLVAGLARC